MSDDGHDIFVTVHMFRSDEKVEITVQSPDDETVPDRTETYTDTITVAELYIIMDMLIRVMEKADSKASLA